LEIGDHYENNNIDIIFSGPMVVVAAVQSELQYLIGEDPMTFDAANTRCTDLDASLVIFENEDQFDEFMSDNTL
jgi:hypothetical protein